MKRSGRLVALSVLLGALVYAALSLVSISAAPEGFASWQDYIGALGEQNGTEALPAFYAAQAALGRPGLWLMGLTALSAILTGIIAAYRATTRMRSTMAEDHILSKRFSGTSFCILFSMSLSILVSFLGRSALEWFVELTTFGAIVGFGYTSASAWRIARREGDRPVQRTGLAGTVITAAFAVVQLIPRLTAIETMGAQSYLVLALWCLLGFVFYWRTMAHGDLRAYRGAATSSAVLFSLLLYSALMWFTARLLAGAETQAQRDGITAGCVLLVALVFLGLAVILYIQNLLRRRQEALEREMIHAEEESRAKSRFLFNMSHDIRTPMNAIMGFTHLARQPGATLEEKDRCLAKIESSGGQLLGIIGDVLDMSRIESGRLELFPAPMDLREAMEEQRDLFAAQMEQKDLGFSLETEALRDPWVLCDKNRLHRALLNLIGNAFKFTPEGGRVEVRLRQTGGDGTTGEYLLTVRDNGIGMNPDFLAKVFTPFERERTSTVSGIQGTGLGLSITKSIIDQMGGTVEVSSRPGEGSEFRVALSLPVAAPQVSPAAEAAEPFDLRRLRLLLVEDNELNREIAQTVLEQQGAAVETAENGQVAVDMVCSAEPGWYDAVLMDIQMPVMDGYAAARAIRTLADPALAGIPIIAMTANAFQEDVQNALEAGMQAHLAKPLDMEKLLETLKTTITQGNGGYEDGTDFS